MAAAALTDSPAAIGSAEPPAPPFGAHRPSRLFAALRRTALGCAESHPLRKPLRRLLASATGKVPQPIDLEHAGLKLRLYPRDNIQDRWIVKVGRHPEEDEAAMFRGWSGRDLRFVDIGANIGYFSLLAHRIAGTGAKLLAIEPHPRTFAKLSANLQLNGAGRVQAVRAAVGAADGEASLSEKPGNEGENSLRDGDEGGTMVPVKPLTAILDAAGFDRIDVLKIDVEGYEDEALPPFLAAADPQLWPGLISMEVSRADAWRVDVVQELRGRGYRVVFEQGPNLMLARDGVAFDGKE